MTAPSEAKWIERADVYKGDRVAGTIVRTASGTEFAYDDTYIAEAGRPVASTLPIRSNPYITGSGALPPFFTGLLPEGARLQAVIRAVGTSADDELSLLLAVGSDTVGDVRILPEGTLPPQPSDNLPSDPSQVQFRQLFADATDPDSDRLDAALPGVQDKISDSMISFHIRRSRRAAILKLDPADYPLITRNENFFLTVAKSAGFAVPAHELVTDRDGETGLLVERFDRLTRPADSMIRIAQEDACQFLARYPADKYRVSINDIATKVVDLVTSPEAAVLDLTLQQAFAWMIGNGDLHAKNYSLQFRPDGLVAATPLYDIVSTLPYPLRQNTALRLEGRDDNFTLAHFVGFAGRFGVPERLITRRVANMVKGTEPYLSDIPTIGYDDLTSERMEAEIRRRMDTLRHS
ncbi:MAG: type II toxin-antitoxin system HipA family toxin [Acidimicrobiia bacterium]|nr:MAG: type II toxin-antitoxin system HipA family toxin [Acidimicrobiia bacterium]